MTSFAQFIIRYRAVFLIVLTIVTALAGYKAAQIKFDFTVQAIFSGDDDLVSYAEQFKRDFGYDDAVMLVVFKSSGHDVLSREALQWMADVSERLKALPSVRGIDSLTTINVAKFRWLGRPPIYAAPILDLSRPIDDAAAARVRATLSRTRMIDGTLVSEDRKAGMIVAYLDPSTRDVDSTRRATDAARRVLAETPPPGDFTVGLGGLAPLRVDVVDSLAKDQERLLPLAGVMFIVILMVLFGRRRAALLSVLAAAIGLGWTLAVTVLAGETLNIISNILPVLVMIIGVSSVIHVALRYGEEYERVPDRKTAAVRTLEFMTIPCLLTTLITTVGFYSLAGAHSKLLQTLAWQLALGLVFLYLATIFFLGPALPYVRPPQHADAKTQSSFLLTRLAKLTAEFVCWNPLLILLTALVVFVGSIAIGWRVPINSYVLETFDPSHPTHKLIKLMEDNLSGLVPLDVSLTADSPDRFFEPGTFLKIAELEDYAADQPGVLLARSYVDIVEEILAGAAGKASPVKPIRDAIDALVEDEPPGEEPSSLPPHAHPHTHLHPDFKKLYRARQVLEMVGEQTGFRTFMRADGERARLLLRIGDIGTLKTLQIVNRLDVKLSHLFPPGSGIEWRVTGDAYLNAKSLDTLIRELFSSLITAGVVTFLAIAGLLWSLRLGLIAVAPQLLPLAAVFGYLALRGYELNVGNIIVLSISLGVVTDNTIHFIARFEEELPECHGDAKLAIKRAYAAAGRAMFLTTLILVSGLSVLMFSEFVPTRRFAELTIVTMIWALIGDVFVLPACLLVFGGRTPKSPVAEMIDWNIPPSQSPSAGTDETDVSAEGATTADPGGGARRHSPDV